MKYLPRPHSWTAAVGWGRAGETGSCASSVLKKTQVISFPTVFRNIHKAVGLDWTIINEPSHDNINKVAYAPGEDSDQPGHPPSLIRVFAVRMKKAWVLSYLLSAQRKLIRPG